ncbi:MAG: hypothetical protein COX43_03655 [Parcubacteria group bacterium CG23_combo_of_CG06-09_8_20_14_all_35_9]|nr:MAG: hypothetical protein COX43_03655 [Parcubacteria group bacterium CG23_combo_of_CG06-09_8_20_14_all_35_9]
MNHNEVKNLIENIITSYNVRLKLVENIITNTRKTLEEFKTKREEMSRKLRDSLAKSANLRKKDFNKMMEEILQVQTKREENINKMLADFHKEEEQVVAKLKNLLQKGEEIRIKDFKKMLIKIKNSQEVREKSTGEKVTSEIERMRQEVSEMLTVFKKEREKMVLVLNHKL